MLYAKKKPTNSSFLLSEAASADLLDVKNSDEVEASIEELEEILTNNIEEVKPEDKETNNAVLTAESCPVWETDMGYVVDLRDLMRVCESEEELTGEPADPAEVAADIQEVNDIPATVPAEDGEGEVEQKLVIVAPVDVAQELVESAILEAKCGRSGAKKKALDGLSAALKSLKDAGHKVVRKAPKAKAKKD